MQKERPFEDPAQQRLEEESDGEVEEQDLEWRGGVRPAGQEDVVQFVEYLEEDEELEELEEDEGEGEDLVSPLVEKKADLANTASLKKTRKRSQVCLVSDQSAPVSPHQFDKSSIYKLTTAPKLPDHHHHHRHHRDQKSIWGQIKMQKA